MKIFGIDSRKLALWLVIIGVAAAVLSGLALAVSGLPQSIRVGREWPVQNDEGKGSQISESRSFPIDGIKGIDVTLSFEDAFFGVTAGTGGESGEIGVQYSGYGRLSVAGRDVFSADVKSGRLVLQSDWKGYPLRNGRMKLEVSVPAGWSGDLDFSGVSGNLVLNGLNPGNLDARLISGDLTLKNLGSESVILKNTSGDITGTGLSSGSARVTAVSGDIRLEEVSIREVLETRTTSGDIAMTGLSGSLEVKSTSGDVEAIFEAPGERVDIVSTSGSIRVALPADASFALRAGTVSGRMRSDFPIAMSGEMNSRRLEGVVGNGGGIALNLGSTSGDIVLEKR